MRIVQHGETKPRSRGDEPVLMIFWLVEILKTPLTRG